MNNFSQVTEASAQVLSQVDAVKRTITSAANEAANIAAGIDVLTTAITKAVQTGKDTIEAMQAAEAAATARAERAQAQAEKLVADANGQIAAARTQAGALEQKVRLLTVELSDLQAARDRVRVELLPFLGQK